MTPRRELQLAVALCLLGAALVWWATGQAWVTEVESGLTIGGTRTETPGSELAAACRPLALVGLAGVVAVAATRRWGRVLVGLCVLAAGVGVVVDAGDVLGGPVPLTAPGWAWAALAGGVVLAAAGLLTAYRGRGWAGLSSAYEPPGTPTAASGVPVAPPAGDKAVWDALDRGDDPTA